MNLLSPRLTYLYAFLSAFFMIILAIYLQFWKGLTPCPLCVLQRITLVAIGIVFFIGTTISFKKFGLRFIAALTLLLSLGGVFLAGRQVWIQHLPANQSADCGVSLQYMLSVLPLDQVVKKIFEGTAECSLVDWSFAGISLAQWSLIWFMIFTFFAVWQLCRKI